MAEYYILRSEDCYGVNPVINQLFMTRLSAEAYAQLIYPAVHLMPRRVNDRRDATYIFVDHATWQEREQTWVTQGHYRSPCWENENWWREAIYNDASIINQYVHISLEDPGMVAFTASESDGERDRQTRMRPGKYLAKYFGDKLTLKQIAFYAEWFTSGTRPLIEIDAEMKFAKTPEEIVEVYMNGPSSCMAKEAFGNASSHPCQVYGAGDLAVAYLQRASGQVIARALCWPEKKYTGRIYPTPDNWNQDGFASFDEARTVNDALMYRLKKDGYVMHSEDGAGLNGARLLKVRHPHGGWRMPYIDYYGVDDGGEFWTMNNSPDYDCSETDGTMGGDGNEDMRTCDRCGDQYDDDNTTYTVATQWGMRSPTDHETWCEHCDSNYSFYCDGCGETISHNVASVMVNGIDYAEPWFLANGGYICEATDEPYFVEDEPSVTVECGGITETWCESYFTDNGFTCTWNGVNYPAHMMSATYPGFADLHDDEGELSIPFAERVRHHPFVADTLVPAAVARLGDDFSMNDLHAWIVERGEDPSRYITKSGTLRQRFKPVQPKAEPEPEVVATINCTLPNYAPISWGSTSSFAQVYDPGTYTSGASANVQREAMAVLTATRITPRR